MDAAKMPAAFAALLDQVKGHLPESAAGEVDKALGGGTAGLGDLAQKVAGMFGK